MRKVKSVTFLGVLREGGSRWLAVRGEERGGGELLLVAAHGQLLGGEGQLNVVQVEDFRGDLRRM